MLDDDRNVRVSISAMLKSAGIDARPFASGPDLIDSLAELQPGVILLDIFMPELDAFEVMTALARKGNDWPVIVMTGDGEVSMAVRAMKLGAIDFLQKPFGDTVLLEALDRAFLTLNQRRERADREREAKARIAALSPRESEVLQGLLTGLPNKALARRLEISLRTVEMHRANMMTRLEVASLAEALMLAVAAGVEPLERQPDEEPRNPTS